MLTPFVLFPDSMGGVLWRLLNAGALVGGMFWCVRAVFPHLLRRSELALFFLLVLPLAVGNFNNGQANPLVLGLVLSTLAAAAESRWNLAALCMVLACLLKVYPIALGIVLAILYLRQFAGRLTIALAAGLILPFLFQHVDYVRMQYAEWLACLFGDDRHARPLDTCYRDFQLICRVWFVPLSPVVYRVLESVAGAGVAALCLMGRRADWPEIRLLSFLLGLVCCWMTVFGPATESATYILLAPSLAYAVIESWAFRSSAWLRGLLMGNYGLLVIAQMEAWFSGGGLLRSHGLQPLAGLLFLVNLLLAHFLKAKAVAGQPATLLASSAAAA